MLFLLAWLWLWACCWHVLGLELRLGPRLVLELESLLGLAMIIGQRISPWLEPDTGLGLDGGLSS